MRRGRRQKGDIIARCTLIAVGMLLAWCPCAFALDPALDVSQYAHTAWKVREGFSKGYVNSMTQTPDGYLWLGTEFGLLRFDGVRPVPWQPPANQHLPSSRIMSLLAARDGTLWSGTLEGFASWMGGKLTQYPELAGRLIMTLLEDREGNIWVATTNGFDRFRDIAVATFSGNQGVSNFPGGSVLTGRDGSVWLDTNDGLSRWNNGRITNYHERTSQVAASKQNALGRAREISVSGFPKPGLLSLFQDNRGRIWVSTFQGVGYLENERSIFINGVAGGIVYSIAEDTGGNLWIANLDHGLLQLRGNSVVQQIPWARLGRKDHALALAADPVKGGLWLGFFEGGVAYFRDGQVRASYTSADGLGGGYVTSTPTSSGGMLLEPTATRSKSQAPATRSTSPGRRRLQL